MPTYRLYTGRDYVGAYTASELADVVARLTEQGEVTLRIVPQASA